MMCQQTKWVFPDTKPDGILVPCGKCLNCLMNKRNDWAFRLMQEYRHSKSGLFITLTYHSKYVPDQGVDKEHFQKFMKRLRHTTSQRLRYYGVGEYGTVTGRPHYHIILFNYDQGLEGLSHLGPTLGLRLKQYLPTRYARSLAYATVRGAVQWRVPLPVILMIRRQCTKLCSSQLRCQRRLCTCA